MGNTSISNKRRRAPYIDNNQVSIIHTTLLTVRYNKEVYGRLKKENETTSAVIIRKRYSARCRHCRAVKEKVRELNTELIFLPPYSPNLNIIGRLWKYTRRHVLAGKYFDTPAKFHDALRHFFEVEYVSNKSNLKSLLIFKFQLFENAQLLCA